VRECETIRADTRATEDSIAFIEKTYREKDPVYADFSIQQQQLLLQGSTRNGPGANAKNGL